MSSLTHLRSSPTAHQVSKPPVPNRSSPIVVAMATNKDNSSDTKRVAVVGAGVSGLAAAHKLKSQGVAVTLFEADKRAGGKIRTVKQDGLIWDEGANTMTESEREVTDLIDDLGLRDKLQLPIAQNKRYVARNGSPLLLPSGPVSLLKSNVLSAKSKLKIALEPFLGNKGETSKVADEHSIESVGEFFERHFGREFVDYLIDPFLAGTCAGDPVSVSMRHAFPELWNIEKRFDSVILGAIRSKLASGKEKSKDTKSSSRQRGSFSFRGGMQTLIDTICNEFSEDELKLQAKVLSLSYSDDKLSSMQKWSVSSTSNNMQDQPFDAIVMTAPISHVKEMKISRRGNPFSLDFLPEVDCLPLSVIITTFKKANVKQPLEGFGVLVPSKEQKNGLNTLGTLFSSMMFPDRAPSDVHLYTTFVGGSRNRELAKASTEELKQIVSSDLHQLLGAEGEPTFIHHCFWSKAFPLYGRSYDSVLNAITKMESDLPGFFYAGNHKDGLSVGKAIASGYKAAELVISYLDSYPLEKIAQETSAS